MSDTTNTSTPPKKMWTRCNGCQDRIYNDPHDIKIHAQHCPQDLLLAQQKLRLIVFGDKSIPGTVDNSLVARLTNLEQIVGDLDDHITEPALDPDGVDLDAYTDILGTTTTDSDDFDELTTVSVETLDDEDELDPTTVTYGPLT